MNNKKEYINYYQCGICEIAWNGTWGCQCNDKCPGCNKEYEPFYSNESGGEAETKYKLERELHILQEVREGCAQAPMLFYNEEAAGNLFQKLISDPSKGFRRKKSIETWKEYRDSFHDYTCSDEISYDPVDWEIHWRMYFLPSLINKG